ncbi:biotin transporter BioY [Halomarina oriensis]|uniref:Biotin transporter BioY n=1 Tax=Halomarina oriensis TaxID=671145 RepID=A0A6B0GP60_9EURY|nr:biotin transporter BioY [Halomarina oriensis]MWG34453.1 biotin transporter BioY [Halomarina oriensis]
MSTQEQSVDLVDAATALALARVALFAALAGAFAFVSFEYPLSPAPVTLQVLAVFLAGLFLGPVWGSVSMAVYLVAGAVGLPVFAGATAGVGVLFGPTGGYLLSYPLAAGVIGHLAHGGPSLRSLDDVGLPRLVGSLVAGVVVIYTVGTLGLVYFGGLGLEAAIVGGTLVFLPAEALKLVAAVGIARSDDVALD